MQLKRQQGPGSSWFAVTKHVIGCIGCIKLTLDHPDRLSRSRDTWWKEYSTHTAHALFACLYIGTKKNASPGPKRKRMILMALKHTGEVYDSTTNIVQYSTAHKRAIWYSKVQYSTVQYSTVQNTTVQ